MKYLALILLLTISCTVYQPYVNYMEETDKSEYVYSELGIIKVNEIYITLEPYGNLYSFAARVDNGKTIGKMPVIIDSTRGGMVLAFSSFNNLRVYLLRHGWEYQYTVTLIDYETLITYFAFKKIE